MKTHADRIFQWVINIFLSLLAIFTALPIIMLIMSSVTDEKVLARYGYGFIPRQFSMGAYQYLMVQGASIFRAYGITVLITVVGTIVSLLITSMLSYPLSRKDFKKRNIILFLVFFTMLFNGGIVPSYIMWSTIFHIKDTLFAYLLPNLLVNAFNVILMKNYFANNIPASIIEAAQIDCAGEWLIYREIILPLSLPILATLGLLTGLFYWNDWINGLYYINNSYLNSIQVILNNMLTNAQYLFTSNTTTIPSNAAALPSRSIRMAIAVLGMVPAIALYPFFQKYFVKGIAVGAVKG